MRSATTVCSLRYLNGEYMSEKKEVFDTWIVNNINLSLDYDEEELVRGAKKKLSDAGIDAAGATFKLRRRSVDARKRDSIKLVCSVIAKTKETKMTKKSADISALENVSLDIEYGKKALEKRPVIVGMGPAGMFCALILAENGYAPIVLERGEGVDDRAAAFERFCRDGVLDPESNIQFGAGGAGTFSDGKLVTRINDEKCSYVLERFHEFGAHEEILYDAKPHIGSDVLRDVVKNLESRIISLGGEVHYRHRVDDIRIVEKRAVSVLASGNEIDCSLVVLAIGHSARDTYQKLIEKDMFVEPKPFSVGLRIEHLQSDIDRALYGSYAGHPRLKRGEYALSYRAGDRGVYTFCMCPGGEVVAAASEAGGVVVNGMSSYARDGKNANSAVCVSVKTEDYGNTPQGAIEYQRQLERAAYTAGGKNYNVPLQTLGDFMEGRVGSEPKRITSTYMGGGKYTLCDLNSILPGYISGSLKKGLADFDRKIKGFAIPDALLSGIETRTSAPVRITRNEERLALGYENIYPCGEGAGYAGGITSAAIDGINTALAIMKRYSAQKQN